MPISDEVIRKEGDGFLLCRANETVADAFYKLKEADGHVWWMLIVEFPNGRFGAIQASELWRQFEAAEDPAAFAHKPLREVVQPNVEVVERGSMGTAEAEQRIPTSPPMLLVVFEEGEEADHFVGILRRMTFGGPGVEIDYDLLEDALMPGAPVSMRPRMEEEAPFEEAPSPPPPPAMAPPPPLAGEPYAAPAAAPQPAEKEAEEQAFNVLVVDGKTGQRQPAATPLLLNRPEPYLLRVFIGPWAEEQEMTARDRFAAEEELREQVFEEGVATVFCVVTSQTVTFGEFEESVVIRELRVPERGSSNVIELKMAFARAGQHFVDVDLYFHNHLLHSKTLACYAVESEGQVAETPITTKVTFLRERAFTPRELDDKVVRLTLRYAPPTPERGPSFTVLQPDQTAEEAPTFFTDLDPLKLKQFAEAARRWLGEVASTNQHGGAGQWNAFATHLTHLARIGRDFYHAAFPGRKGREALAALHDARRDTVIQVAPIAANASVPWGVVYDRPLDVAKYVCDKFAEHGLHDCPYGDDVVCPTGFWGYRHIIEQIPCWADDPLLQPITERPDRVPRLQRFIHNPPGALTYCLDAYPFGTVVSQHRAYMERLAGSKGMALRLGQSVDEVKQQFLQGGIHLVHFFVHGHEQDGSHVLIIQDGDFLEPGRIAAWEAQLWDEAPLVLLSGCGTSSYTPEDFSSLIVALLRSGVAGVLGTEVTIYTSAALEYANQFFDYILHGTTAGHAMRDITRRLMVQYNPYGLVYTLFAASGIRLRHPLLASTP